VVPQLHELLTHYGEVSALWFDIPGGVINLPRADLIAHEVIQDQPNIVIDNRLGGGYAGDCPDTGTVYSGRRIPRLRLGIVHHDERYLGIQGGRSPL